MTDAACPFCVIVAGEDPSAREIYRDANAVAFFPREPATHGHTLVVPTRHVRHVWELTDSDLTSLSLVTIKVAGAIRTAVAPEGLNIIQSNGHAAAQTVEHVHVHVVPRWENDRMTEFWPAGTEETSADIASAARKITAALSGGTSTTSAEDRRQHLVFVQSVVARLAQASSTAKAWLLPIVTATYGYAITKNAPGIALLGVVAVMVFALLDANYLKEERAFRQLYDEVAGDGPVPAFSMNPAVAGHNRQRRNYWPDLRDWKSWSVAPVYLPLVMTGLVIAVLYAWVW
ncbi:histidine triad (HIT) family protein [Nocardia kruczakiae]|uniref:Histidine triad (HIT) family protein n=1 Tax=Nocardia kruczakiae TaxID=261477 RepID=A0ABU1XFN5_9NOCA|nr:HIT domain-containing protein [Nocardia kruczakiae]MDR7169358.1 histidine triad (HIT) family protein [Nocardia kruczakiae]